MTLTSSDRLEIQNLNSRHFHSLDALDRVLPGDPAETWAKTFHDDGIFETQTSDGTIIFQAKGQKELLVHIEAFQISVLLDIGFVIF